MAMLYRHHVEFGVGHGVSLHADCPTGVCDKAYRLSTCVVPDYEVPRTTPPTAADWPKLDGLVLDMKQLGEMPTAELGTKLRPLITAYAAWIKDRQTDLKKPDLALYQKAGKSSLERCQDTLERIEAGLKLVLEDEMAANAFRFANLAMWKQRIQTIVSLTATTWTSRSMNGPSTFRRIVLGIRSSLPSYCSTCRASPASTTRTARPSQRRWPTSCGSQQAAARRRRISGCLPTRWACGGSREPWLGVPVSSALRC